MAWKLLSETRRACLRAGLAGTAAVLLLVFAQTVGGILSGVVAQAWGWVLLVLLPVLLLLWASAMFNRYPAKIIHPTAHQSLVWGSWTYQWLILLTLLAEPFATREDLSIVGYLAQSLWWLLPMEALLLVGYWLVFYRKDLIFKPNEKIILDFATEKAADSKDKGNLLRQQCFELVAANDLPGVFAKMKETFGKTGGDDLKESILLQGQFTALSKEKEMNMVDPGKAQIELNRIAMAVLNLVEKM
ncbi:MAG: hypothetical protein IPH31_15450 [Lewinellaceae bacterium]|nr:hypothetical protein [Lewinellaceae bacterium]